MVHLQCPRCRQTLSAGEPAPAQVQCPACSHVFATASSSPRPVSGAAIAAAPLPPPVTRPVPEAVPTVYPAAQAAPPPLPQAAAAGAAPAATGKAQRAITVGVGLVSFCLALFCGCGAIGYLIYLFRAEPTPQQEASAGDDGGIDANWMVVFRGDDPSIWNTDRPGEPFALPASRAPRDCRYVRLKRLDTDEFLIVPITYAQLFKEERAKSGQGYWWNGSAQDAWGGRHLGIVQVPPPPSGEHGLVSVAWDPWLAYVGSGFGHRTAVNTQGCSWQGKEIPKTAFEIAVTSDPLSAREKRRLVDSEPNNDPPPRGWTVLFRSDDPSIWNTISPDDRNFAIPVSRAHPDIHFVRLTRIDTGEALIVPITYEQLGREPKPMPDNGVAWNGGGRLAYKARGLGIAQAPRHRFPAVPHGLFCVVGEGWDAFSGSGFGGKAHINDGQYCGWKGEAIPKTAFEIAVTCDALTREEEQQLVK